jgi:hypothetical protein
VSWLNPGLMVDTFQSGAVMGSEQVEAGFEVIPNYIRSGLEPPNRGLSTLKKISLNRNPRRAHETAVHGLEGVFCGLSLRNSYVL